MSNPTEFRVSKWPFFAGEVVLLGMACLVVLGPGHATSALGLWQAVLVVFCGALGAALAVTPYLLDYQVAVKMAETGAVISTLNQIQNLEQVAAQIAGATAQWQTIQEVSTRTTAAADGIATRMTAEAVAFKDFMQKANDVERSNLRLEVEKLRRAENEWLQVTVRILDHTYALHVAAVRSGQPGLIENLGQFQNACRDVARRMGLVPFSPAANEPFDPACQESPDSQAMSVADARIRETIATGYTFQGRLIRPALVSLQNPPLSPAGEEAVEAAAAVPANGNAGRDAAEIEEGRLL